MEARSQEDRGARDSRDDHGKAGGRFLLQLAEQGETTVVYAAELSTGGAVVRGEARIEFDGGNVTFSWPAGDAPAWLVDATRAALRTLWRARNTGTSHDSEAWPRRIKRWRFSPQSRQGGGEGPGQRS